MKLLFYILGIMLPQLVYAQTDSLNRLELYEFTTLFSDLQIQDTNHLQNIIDSNIFVSAGVCVEISIREEICTYPNGSIRFVRYYRNNNPFGNWKYYSINGMLKYSLINSENRVFLRSYTRDTSYHKQREFESIENLNTSKCIEQSYHTSGKIIAAGSREPVKNKSQVVLVETGKWFYYFPTGEIESSGKFENGEKEGKWIYYNQKGKKTNSIKFKNGQVISGKLRLK